MVEYEKIREIVLNGEIDNIESAVNEEVGLGKDPQEILNKGLIEPLTDLGVRFQSGEVFVPELLIASETMQKGIETLKPLLQKGAVQNLGKCLFCTVEGDVHDIGKNLVILFLESFGFEVVDLGSDVDVDDIVEAIQEDEEIKILGMSAMLTTTMYTMGDVIDELKDAGLRDRVKIMVGGAPLNQDFADKIGADGYSANAPEAVELAKRLIEEI